MPRAAARTSATWDRVRGRTVGLDRSGPSGISAAPERGSPMSSSRCMSKSSFMASRGAARSSLAPFRVERLAQGLVGAEDEDLDGTRGGAEDLGGLYEA